LNADRFHGEYPILEDIWIDSAVIEKCLPIMFKRTEASHNLTAGRKQAKARIYKQGDNWQNFAVCTDALRGGEDAGIG